MSEKAYDDAVRQQLRNRARIVKDTEVEVRRLLAVALKKVLARIADQPSDYQAWSLPILSQEIGRIAGEMGDATTASLAQAASRAWQAGHDLVVEPLAGWLGAESSLRLASFAPRLDTRMLVAMQHFMADRMKDVSIKAANAINGELGLVVIGAQGPWEAQQAIKSILREKSMARAATIVSTELQRVFAVANQQTLAAADSAGIAMDKVWRRSGKAHPRISHALADGRRVAWDKPFVIDGESMMHPHDPKASAKNVINCGCVAVPKPRDMQATMNDHRPFTQAELARNPTLNAIANG